MRRDNKKSGRAKPSDVTEPARSVCPEVGEPCGRFDIFKVPCEKDVSCFIKNKRKAQEVIS